MKVFSTDTNFLSNLQSKTQYQIGDPRIICKILSDSLYSNKIGSIVRELSANALDAHREAKKADIPFEVHLPVSGKALFTEDDKYFSIRDFGLGLSEDEMISLYTMYGGSNKRDTNRMIGGFGIGSKSPFAYTNQFEVTSFNGGRKKHYLCFIDENEYPCITKLSDEESDEPSGFLVKININNDKDATSFLYEGVKQYAFYDVCPISNVNVNSFSFSKYIETDRYIVYRKQDNEEKLNTIRSIIGIVGYSSRDVLCMDNLKANVYIRMNNTIYEIPKEVQTATGFVDSCDLFRNSTIVLKADIGECDVNASRENLANTELTQNTFKKLAFVFSETIIKEISKRIKNLTDFEIINYAIGNSIYANDNRTPYYYSHRSNCIPFTPKNPNKECEKILDILKNGIKFNYKKFTEYLESKSIKFYYYDTNKYGAFGKMRKSLKVETRRNNATLVDVNASRTSSDFYFIPTFHIKFNFVNEKVYLSTVSNYLSNHKMDEDRTYIFFTTNPDDIEFIRKSYGYPEYSILDLKNDKKAIPSEKKVVKDNIEYYKFPIAAARIAYLRDFKTSHKNYTVIEPIDDFMKELDKDTVMFVISNNELVSSNGMRYQKHLYNILYHFATSYCKDLNVIMVNENNFRKFCGQSKHNNYFQVGYEYATKIIETYFTKYGLFFDNMDEVLTMYDRNNKLVTNFLTNIEKEYIHKHCNNKFFDLLNKVSLIDNKYIDNPIITELISFYRLSNENLFTDRKTIEWYDDYMDKNPILKLIGANHYYYGYYNSPDTIKVILDCLEKYMTDCMEERN